MSNSEDPELKWLISTISASLHILEIEAAQDLEIK